ncbi:unnamed protein product [Prunus armeniaca]
MLVLLSMPHATHAEPKIHLKACQNYLGNLLSPPFAAAQPVSCRKKKVPYTISRQQMSPMNYVNEVCKRYEDGEEEEEKPAQSINMKRNK